jgi:acid phosphatase family membrane protein YuiD
VEAFWLALLVGFLVQGYKGLSEFLRTRHWNLRRFVETGGMPSSHSAAVATLSAEVAFRQGVHSLLFGVTLYFSLVVMYDAAGLRRAAGRQAALLNRLIDQHWKDPGQGALIGLSASLLWHWIR